MLSTVIRKTDALYNCLDFVRHPTARNSFKIAEGIKDSNDLRRAVARMRENPEIAPMFQDRYLRGFADLDRLIQLPAGSLGYELAKKMKSMNLTADVYPGVDMDGDVGYFLRRGRETHDLWHLMTGFETDVPGELGLQAFQLAQLHVPISKVLVGLGVLRTAFYPDSLVPVLNAVVHGWTVGRNARPLIAQRFEDAWERPLVEWRRMLGVVPFVPEIR
jgi:ubiquinone biosynthesis protein Coq4